MLTKLRFGLLLVILAVATSSAPAQPKLNSDRIIELVNKDRAELGLAPLKLNRTLSAAAMAKAYDMMTKQYFAHISPEGTKPWHWFTALGYRYVYAGENLALGFNDAVELQNSWMSSPTHRANILSPFYAETGLAIVEDNNKTLIVQFFGNEAGQVTLRQ